MTLLNPLKQLLLFARNLIDRILAKIDPPKPIHFKPFPLLYTVPVTGGWNYWSLDGSASVPATYCPTCVGTTADVNVYNQG